MIPSRSSLFPLNTVLFPGCQLPLQIFEQRYLRLVKECMRDDTGFVVVLIAEGNEVGAPPQVYSTGTWVRISDWKTLENGLLGITITAQQRVKVNHPSAQDDGLLTAEIHALADDANEAGIIDDYKDLADTLRQLEQHPYSRQFGMRIDYQDCVDITNKLSYLLPVSSIDKQTLLETPDLRQRCELLRSIITRLQHLQTND